MNSMFKAHIAPLIGIIVLAAVIVFSMTGCETPTNSTNGKGLAGADDPVNQTPVADDYEIAGTGPFTYDGTAKPVTVTAKAGKSPGAVSVFYEALETEPVDVGTYTVTFDVAAAEGWNAASGLPAGTVTITEPTGTKITSVAIHITVPVKGGTPDTAATTEDEHYSIGDVSWSPNDNPFAGETIYTATVTLTADSEHTFYGLTSATVNEVNAEISPYPAATLTLSYDFPKTLAKTVTKIEIKEQPTKIEYTHGEELELAGLTVTLTYEDAADTPDNVEADDFAEYGITTSLMNGTRLIHTTHDKQKIEVKYDTFEEETNALTVNAKDISGEDISVEAIPEQTYTGSEINPAVTVKDGDNVLELDTDYTVAYNNHTNAKASTETDSPNVTITGKGNYTDTKTVNFTINKANPTVTWPTAAAITYGAALSTSSLTGGSAGTVQGSFAWTNGAIIPTVTNSGYEVTFTPTDTANYHKLTHTVSITVNKATPSIITWPTAAAITYGAALSTSALTGGSAGTVQGSFAWTNGATIPSVTNSGYNVTFTPNDSANYNTVAQNVNITVNKANPTVNWPTGLTATYGQTLANVTLPGNGTSSPAGAFSWTAGNTTSVGNVGTNAHNLTFTPTDTANYNTLAANSVNVNVSRKSVTITGLSAENKTYDGNTGATVSGTATISGAVSGDNVSVTAGTAAFADKNAANGKTVTFSGYSLSGTAAANYTLSAQPASVTANITRKTITITGVTATNRNYAAGNTSVALSGGALQGVVSGDTVNFTLGNGAMANADVGNGKAVTTNIQLGGSAAGNYTLTQPSGITVNILGQAPGITITFPQITGEPLNVSGNNYNASTNTITISRNGRNGVPSALNLTLDNPAQYDANSISWVLNPGNITQAGASFTYTSPDSLDYTGTDHFTLTLTVKKNNVPYNRTIKLEVTP